MNSKRTSKKSGTSVTADLPVERRKAAGIRGGFLVSLAGLANVRRTGTVETTTKTVESGDRMDNFQIQN